MCERRVCVTHCNLLNSISFLQIRAASMASNNLSSLLAASKALTSHLQRPDLPSVNLSLDQIEAQSRRLVAGQPGAPADSGRGCVLPVLWIQTCLTRLCSSRRNYLLAQAHVDAPALATSIANLNTTTTFSPLQPLQDTDITGYLRHAHEQNLISTIEEGRRETQEEFYRTLEEHGRREWEAKKKRVFEELGGRLGGENAAVSDFKKSSYGRNILAVSLPASKLSSLLLTLKTGFSCSDTEPSVAEQDDDLRPCSD